MAWHAHLCRYLPIVCPSIRPSVRLPAHRLPLLQFLWSVLAAMLPEPLTPAEPLRKEGPLDPGQRLPSGPPAPLWALARCPLECLIRSLGARDPVCPSHQSFQVPSPHRPSLSSREGSVTALCSEGLGRAPIRSSRVQAKNCVCVCVRACMFMLALMFMYV